MRYTDHSATETSMSMIWQVYTFLVATYYCPQGHPVRVLYDA